MFIETFSDLAVKLLITLSATDEEDGLAVELLELEGVLVLEELLELELDVALLALVVDEVIGVEDEDDAEEVLFEQLAIVDTQATKATNDNLLNILIDILFLL